MDKMIVIASHRLATEIMYVAHMAISRPQFVNVIHFDILLAHFGSPIFRFFLLPTTLYFDVRVI